MQIFSPPKHDTYAHTRRDATRRAVHIIHQACFIISLTLSLPSLPPSSVFPNGARWSRVNECKDGCVYLLKMNDSDVKHFFWSQESRTDEKKATKRDAEILKKISNLIANPPIFGAPLPKDEDEKEDITMEDATTSISVDSVGGVALVQGMDHAPSGSGAIQGSIVHPASNAVAGTAPPATPAPAAAASSASAPAPATPLNTNAIMSTLNAMAQQLQARQESRTGVEDVLDPERVQTILVRRHDKREGERGTIKCMTASKVVNDMCVSSILSFLSGCRLCLGRCVG